MSCFLSVISAAFKKCFLMALMECPLASRCLAKLQIRVQKFVFSFCFLKRRKFPTISPLKQLDGCAETGGMYKYKFILFWKVREIILPFVIVSVRSRKFADVDRSLITQRNFPHSFIDVLNSSQVWESRPSVEGFHIPSTSSMNLL